MPTSCVAFGCFNRGKIDGISYHRFPSNEEERQKWVNAVKRKNWEPSKTSRICSAHFREEDINRTLRKVLIQEGAVPAVFAAFPKESQVKDRRLLKRRIQVEVQPVSESPTKRLKTELIRTKSYLLTCKKKRKVLQQKKRRLTKRVANLECILHDLKQKQNFQTEDCSLLMSISKNSDCLIKRAIKKTINPNLKQEYGERLKAFAITLHFLSPKAYNFVRKTFNTALPHPKTLGRWYGSVNAEPGFSEEVFRALKEHSSNVKNKPICALMLDCMAIRKKLEWDGQRFHGTINLGNTQACDDSAPIATEALVFHLVAINSSWKIPLGHFFVISTKGEQLSGLVKQCLGLLHESGIQVVSLTCDGTACNLAMANKLGCSIDPNNLRHSFQHPSTEEPVYFFLDPSHMLKLVRNTLGDSKVLYDSESNRVEWKYLEQLYTQQQEEGLHLGNKLSNSHIRYGKQKMKTKLAAQLLSTSVADSLEFLLQNKVAGFEGCSPTIEFLRIFDKTFDILNSRSIRAKYSKQALYPGNFDKHSEFLLKARDYITNLKDKTGQPIFKSSRKTGFLGLVICINSTLSMYEQFVKSDPPLLMYLPVYKVSQDHLERLFGYIRSRGGHNNNPTCRQFTGSFKRILLHKELQESDTGNALILNRALILPIKKKGEVQSINSTTPGWRSLDEEDQEHINIEEKEEDEAFLTTVDSTSMVSTNIVEYMAGFIVRSLKTKLVCDSCSTLLEGNVTHVHSLINCKNRGGLVQPSESVVKLCLLCESTVKFFKNKGELTMMKNLHDKMTASVLKKCIGLDLFPGHHCFEQEPENNHIILLMKAICKKFFTIRLHHYSKTLSESLHKTKIRHHLIKTITFMGQ